MSEKRSRFHDGSRFIDRVERTDIKGNQFRDDYNHSSGSRISSQKTDTNGDIWRTEYCWGSPYAVEKIGNDGRHKK